MQQTEPNEDRNLAAAEQLVSPRAGEMELPLTDAAAGVVLEARRAIRDVLHGRDRRRLVAIVGPCSIHDPAAARDYAARPERVADATRSARGRHAHLLRSRARRWAGRG
jgi:3-deoxy-7-phosphoheptulonate synthase